MRIVEKIGGNDIYKSPNHYTKVAKTLLSHTRMVLYMPCQYAPTHINDMYIYTHAYIIYIIYI